MICLICSSSHEKDFSCDPDKRICVYCDGNKRSFGENTWITCEYCHGHGYLTWEQLGELLDNVALEYEKRGFTPE